MMKRSFNNLRTLQQMGPYSDRSSVASNDLEVPNLRLQARSDVVTPFIERVFIYSLDYFHGTFIK